MFIKPIPKGTNFRGYLILQNCQKELAKSSTSEN